MPIMDGFEASEKLNEMMKNDELEKAPIVAVSANDSAIDRERGIKAGMVDLVSKPIDL